MTLMTQVVNGSKRERGGRSDGNSRPTKAARKSDKGGGRGGQQQEGTSASGSNAGENQNGVSLREIMRSNQLRKRLILSGPDGKVCFKHQRVRCDKEGCTFAHFCAGCGAKDMGLDWCTCQGQQR